MYTSFHTFVGGALVISSPFIAKATGIDVTYIAASLTAFSVYSHYPVDYLGEVKYRSLIATIIIELFLIMAMSHTVYFFNYPLFKYFLLGMIGSNLIDIIDKAYYFTFRRGVLFRCHITGWDYIKLTEIQTLTANIGCTLLFCLIVPFLIM